MKKLLTIILLFSHINAYSTSCSKNVAYLEEGKTAPCTGYLFSPDQELKVRLLDDQNLFLTDQAKFKDKQLQLYINQAKLSDDLYQKEQQKSVMWRTTAEDATEKLVKADSNRGWRDFAMILVGIGLTCLGAWAVGQVK
jgi:hypothetical protein